MKRDYKSTFSARFHLIALMAAFSAFVPTADANQDAAKPKTVAEFKVLLGGADATKSDQAIEGLKQLGNAGDPAALSALGEYFADRGSDETLEIAIDYYEKSAARGNPWALLRIGDLYRDGKMGKPDAVSAERHYRRAETAKLVAAKLRIAELYLDEGSPLYNAETGVALVREGAAGGDGWAFIRLGDILRDGKLLPQDYRQAMVQYASATAAGVPFGDLKQAQIYLDGPADVKDVKRGLALAESAAKAGDPTANSYLGDIYLRGLDVPVDQAKARDYLLKSWANGNAWALLKLGDMYRDSGPSSENQAEAIRLYRRASEAGIAFADMRLGQGFITRALDGDPAEGIKLLEKAGSAGEADAYSMLADYYAEGSYLPLDGKKAAEFYAKASALGKPSGLLKLGEMYRDGIAVPADQALAFSYFEQAADQGLLSAKIRLGEAYIKGQGVVADVQKGIALIEESSTSQDKWALKTLADYLSRGDYSKPNAVVALSLYKRAADAGNEWAYYRLGEIYRDGQIVPKNPALAIENFKKASSLGLIDAEFALAQGDLYNDFGKLSKKSEGLKRLNQLASKGNEQAVVTLAELYFWGNGVPKNPKKSISLLESASQSGARAATSRLISLYRDAPGGGLKRSIPKAKALLESHKGQFNPAQYAFENVLLVAAEASGRKEYAEINALVRSAPPAVQLDTLTALKNANPNAFVYIAQTEMKQRGLYSGVVNGLLTTSTIKSLNRLCGMSVAGERCKKGPLNYDAARVIAIMINPSATRK
jgi:TPR repeat protein